LLNLHIALESCDISNQQTTAQLAGEGLYWEDPVLDALQKFVPISAHFLLSFQKNLWPENFRKFSRGNFPENHSYFLGNFPEKFHRKLT